MQIIESLFLALVLWTEIVEPLSVISTPENPSIHYHPTWDSLDQRPLPSWYDDAKVGIFIHWGVYSVPSFGTEWFWINWKDPNATVSLKYDQFVKKNYKPGFSYQDFAHDFTADFFNPDDWAALFNASGAKYVVLTSKHHEGYAMWPSTQSFSWNSIDTGPHRNIVGELEHSIRATTDLHFGLYHSLFEWFNPLYMADRANNFTTQTFVETKILPSLHELITDYKPDVLWSDGEWEAESTYWNAELFLAWLYNTSPVKETIVTNDRWGKGTLCKHGGFYTCVDRYNPGKLVKHKWENAMTIDKKSWGYRRNMNVKDILTMEELITEVVQTVSCGGNILINVGPTKEGTIIPIFQERLLGLGKWLSTNGPAIYNTKPWSYQNDTITPGVWYTQSKNGKNVFAMSLNWPDKNILFLNNIEHQPTTIRLLGYGIVKVSYDKQSLQVFFPEKSAVTVEWAWVTELTW